MHSIASFQFLSSHKTLKQEVISCFLGTPAKRYSTRSTFSVSSGPEALAFTLAQELLRGPETGKISLVVATLRDPEAGVVAVAELVAVAGVA